MIHILIPSINKRTRRNFEWGYICFLLQFFGHITNEHSLERLVIQHRVERKCLPTWTSVIQKREKMMTFDLQLYRNELFRKNIFYNVLHNFLINRRNVSVESQQEL